MVTPEETQLLAKRFVDEYGRPPHDEYISVVGCGPIKNVSRPDDWITLARNLGHKVTERLPTRPGKDDNLEDWCLIIGIKSQPPQEIDLPSDYHGAKVFYYKCGEVKLF